MIDKKKELESLEIKYKEIQQLQTESENIISKLKNDIDIYKENELLEENKILRKQIEELKSKLYISNKSISELKNSNLILLDELKSTKRARREKEINRFQNIVAEKLKIDLEEKILFRLNRFQYKFFEKIKKLDKELVKDFSKESQVLKKELDELTKKVEVLTEKTLKQTSSMELELEKESSIFHNKIKEEYNNKEDSYLFEKEKKNFLLEKLIGLKGFNILGVISIFLGIFLVFRTQFKVIFNNDYIKSVGGYLLGVIFLFAGEKLYQNNKKHFSVGIIGGGIGILYLSTLLSTMYLGLFPMYMGLFIAILLTGIAILLALRYESEIIGILALIGGYIPYGAYIYYLKGNTQIYYIAIYSLILQGIILGIAWKKDWLYSKISGFVIGSINMIALVYYLNTILGNKLLSFFYIVIFTTAYSFIFLNSPNNENRKNKIIQQILLGLNLVIKFSLIYSLSDETTPTWLKALLIIGVGIVYGFIGDRVKENYMSKMFNFISLGCFILIIPVILSKEYVVIAWGGESLLLYYLTKKYKNKDMEYGALFIYLVTFISNLFVRTEGYYLVHIQDFMVIALSFAIYFTLKKRELKKYMSEILIGYKYLLFVYSIYFVGNIISTVIDNMEIDYLENYILTSSFTILSINIGLRNITYRVKEFQDRFSLIFLTVVEILSIIYINTLNFVHHYELSYFMQFLIVGTNVYLYLYGRKDIHLCFFRSDEKSAKWMLGESVYILFVSYLMMINILKLQSASLIIDIVGLLICYYLVWKGFKTPNREVRRIGLGIGVLFVFKCFFFDFIKFDSSFKMLAYFGMGVILIGTSYIYQSALKKLEREKEDE